GDRGRVADGVVGVGGLVPGGVGVVLAQVVVEVRRRGREGLGLGVGLGDRLGLVAVAVVGIAHDVGDRAVGLTRHLVDEAVGEVTGGLLVAQGVGDFGRAGF